MHGFEYVVQTGGEPLHRTYRGTTYELIHSLGLNGIKVILNTSGTDLDECDLDRIVELDLYRVDVSIDSHIEQIHNAQRGLFDQTISTIIGLVRRGYGRISTTSVVTDLNADTIGDTLAFLRSVGIDDCRIQPAFVPGEPTSEAVVEAIMKHGGLMRRLCARPMASLPSDAVCQMGKKYFVCDPEGNISVCFHRPDVTIGSLLFDSQESIRDALVENCMSRDEQPSCFGPHCASLFDIPSFWRR